LNTEVEVLLGAQELVGVMRQLRGGGGPVGVVAVPVIVAAADRAGRTVEDARLTERLTRVRRIPGDAAVEPGITNVQQRFVRDRRRVREDRRRRRLRPRPCRRRRLVETVARVRWRFVAMEVADEP